MENKIYKEKNLPENLKRGRSSSETNFNTFSLYNFGMSFVYLSSIFSLYLILGLHTRHLSTEFLLDFVTILLLL